MLMLRLQFGVEIYSLILRRFFLKIKTSQMKIHILSGRWFKIVIASTYWSCSLYLLCVFWAEQDMCMRMTLDTTCKIGFGADLGCLNPSLPEVEFAKAFDDANYFSFYRFADPLWKVKRILSLGQEAKLKKCIKVLDDFSYNVIKMRQKEMATNDKV